MDEGYISIGKSVLSSLFRFYDKQGLDDAEYIPLVRVIIEGMTKAMSSAGLEKRGIQETKKILVAFNRELYVDIWVKHARDDEDRNALDIEYETKTGAYYFDYIYKHGEHPR